MFKADPTPQPAIIGRIKTNWSKQIDHTDLIHINIYGHYGAMSNTHAASLLFLPSKDGS